LSKGHAHDKLTLQQKRARGRKEYKMPRKTKKQTRRGNNEGSIYQRKDGWWVGQVLYGYKPDGKPNRKAVLGRTR